MNGTTAIDTTTAPGGVYAYIAELEQRRLGIEYGEAEQCGETVEQRRAARRRGMEILRLGATQAALTMTEVIAGRLPADHCALFAGIADPLSSLANLNRSIIQIALAEDRFDETAEERAARAAAEAAAARKSDEARAYTAGQLRRAENRRQVQGMVRAVTLTSLGLRYAQREKLVAGLFRELDTIQAYDANPADIVADLCLRLGIATKDLPKLAADHLARKDRMAAVLRAHLEALRGAHELDEGDEDDDSVLAASSVPPAHAQGPPN
jgi:hypothetical protein